MDLILRKTENWETYLALKAVTNFVRSGKLYANERFFQVSNIHTVIRFTHPGIPAGTYRVQFSGDTMARLTDAKGIMPDCQKLFDGAPGATLEQMICGNAASTQLNVSRICGTLPTLPTMQVIVDRYQGKLLNIIHAGPGNPAVISAPCMTMALLPRVNKVKKLLTGIPEALDNTFRDIAEARGISVNKLILEVLDGYANDQK